MPNPSATHCPGCGARRPAAVRDAIVAGAISPEVVCNDCQREAQAKRVRAALARHGERLAAEEAGAQEPPWGGRRGDDHDRP